MLAEALSRHGLTLDHVRRTNFGKPFVDSDIDFNISHSGEYVLLACAKGMKVGIDIEMLKPVEFSDFEKTMTPSQWEFIKSSTFPLRSFYKYWTIKEGVIKAEGEGLSIPLQEIEIGDESAKFREHTWHFKEVDIDEHYFAHVVTSANIGMDKMPILSMNFE